MKEEMLQYLKAQRICALAVEMLDGSPHVATVHFANTEDPLTFIFETSRNYRKSERVLAIGMTRASISVGFTEGDKAKTVQLDGEIRLAKDQDKLLVDFYIDKFPAKKKKLAEHTTIFLIFTSTWWRYTDWGRPEGKTILTSDGKIVVPTPATRA
jgi:uncharacterized protein YhbP (UPF0306 family)